MAVCLKLSSDQSETVSSVSGSLLVTMLGCFVSSKNRYSNLINEQQVSKLVLQFWEQVNPVLLSWECAYEVRGEGHGWCQLSASKIGLRMVTNKNRSILNNVKENHPFKFVELNQPSIIFLLQAMTNSEGIKYICGCGKQYSSYPAYSTHKRIKHNNQEINGTSIPKVLMPKRGRPSFSRPTPKHTLHHTYAALTVVETFLLKLQQTYAPVLTQPESQPELEILNLYEDCQKIVSSDLGAVLLEAVKKLNETVVTHTTSQFAAAVTLFLVDLTAFFLHNLAAAKSIKHEWQSKQDPKIESSLFNKFFNSQANRGNIQKYANDCSKPLKVFFQLTVVLSEYLCKLGLAESTLRMKQ